MSIKVKKMNSFSLKSILQFDSSNKSHQELIQKIAQPFITCKPLQSSSTQINIAGYKTLPLHVSHDQVKDNTQESYISKESIQKYLFTFSFEIGCDLPTQNQIKLIQNLLLAHSKLANHSSELSLQQIQKDQLRQSSIRKKPLPPKIIGNQNISKSSFQLLIKLCLQIYVQSKKSNIGGLFERLIIGIKREIQIQDQNHSDFIQK